MGLLFNIETYNENRPRSWFFTSFCHHLLTTMTVHTHAYRFSLVESGMNTGLRTITLCRKDRVLLNNNTKLTFTTQRVIDVLCAMAI